jgi:hypothetical protein
MNIDRWNARDAVAVRKEKRPRVVRGLFIMMRS